MATARKLSSGSPPLDARLLTKVSQIVSDVAGIQLGDRQRGMVENRLRKRLLDLGLGTGEEYLEHLEHHRAEEIQTLVGLLTTHHTYFFREFSHFEYLETEGLKTVVDAVRSQGRRSIRVWSAASSTGQEAYSLAMFLSFHLRAIAPDFTFEILGTDVDPRSIRIAKNGVYHRKEIKDVPLQYLSGNWARGTGDIADFVKVKSVLRTACRFDVGNLIELARVPVGEPFDLIFCRNVFIYFNAEQIEAITRALIARLAPHGLLFLGISESLRGSNIPLQSFGPSIYAHAAKTAVPKSPTRPEPARPIRVLCVDDSPSVLTLLKQILRPEHGYEVVGTAANGIEAAARVKELSPDALTLDIHMPEMDGLAYLTQHLGAGHPPVVMVSSVSRDDADLAVRCLTRGASDYVEKPALANLVQRGEELRSKLGSAVRNHARGGGRADLSVEKSFAKTFRIGKPEAKLRVVLANLADRERAIGFLNARSGTQPPTLLLFEGAGGALGSIAGSLGGKVHGAFRFVEQLPRAEDLVPGGIFAGDFERLIEEARAAHGSRRTSILVFGEPTSSALRRLQAWTGAQILIEDVGSKEAPTSGAVDRVPATSFEYMATEFLGADDGRG